MGWTPVGSQDTHGLKLKGCDGYIPKVGVVNAVFYAELFNLWSHLSNKFGQFLCSLHCLRINYKIKQLSCIGSELPIPMWTSWGCGGWLQRWPLTVPLPFAMWLCSSVQQRWTLFSPLELGLALELLLAKNVTEMWSPGLRGLKHLLCLSWMPKPDCQVNCWWVTGM